MDEGFQKQKLQESDSQKELQSCNIIDNFISNDLLGTLSLKSFNFQIKGQKFRESLRLHKFADLAMNNLKSIHQIIASEAASMLTTKIFPSLMCLIPVEDGFV